MFNQAGRATHAGQLNRLTRRNLFTKAGFGAPVLMLAGSPAGKAQRAQGLDRTVTEGFVVLGGQTYSQWQRVPSPFGQGGWADVRNAYIGVIQQLRLNWSLDSFSDYAFSSRAVPSPDDIGLLAGKMMQRGYPPSVQGDLAAIIGNRIGQEDATWQQVQARGYDDLHSGNASLFQYYESLVPSGCPPVPAEACQADQTSSAK